MRKGNTKGIIAFGTELVARISWGIVFFFETENCLVTVVRLWKGSLKILNSPLGPQSLPPKSEKCKVNQKQVRL